MEDRKLYAALAFAGASPFVACAVLIATGTPTLEPIGRLDAVVESYGLAIISFLCGAHWATWLYKKSESPFNLMVTSNVVLLAVWFAMLSGNVAVSLSTQVAAFLVLLYIELRIRRAGLIADHYFMVRGIATALAVMSLTLIVVATH